MTIIRDAKFAEGLKERLQDAAIWYLELAGRHSRSLTDFEDAMVDRFSPLAQGVAAAPPALMADERRLAASHPEIFEHALSRMIKQIGRSYRPTSGTDFLRALVSTTLGRTT